jgi:hypothetical protein
MYYVTWTIWLYKLRYIDNHTMPKHWNMLCSEIWHILMVHRCLVSPEQRPTDFSLCVFFSLQVISYFTKIQIFSDIGPLTNTSTLENNSFSHHAISLSWNIRYAGNSSTKYGVKEMTHASSLIIGRYCVTYFWLCDWVDWRH